MSKLFLIPLATTLLFTSCKTDRATDDVAKDVSVSIEPDQKIEPSPDAKPKPSPTETIAAPETPTPSELTDEDRAAALWKKMAGYKSWSAPGGLTGLRDGESIHGDHIRLFGNSTANANFATLPAGSILVKEGYRDDEGTLLKAITAMQKIDGYNAEAGDWFYVRYNDSGTATRINRGCASCHEDAGGDDYAFIND